MHQAVADVVLPQAWLVVHRLRRHIALLHDAKGVLQADHIRPIGALQRERGNCVTSVHGLLPYEIELTQRSRSQKLML